MRPAILAIQHATHAVSLSSNPLVRVLEFRVLLGVHQLVNAGVLVQLHLEEPALFVGAFINLRREEKKETFSNGVRSTGVNETST